MQPDASVIVPTGNRGKPLEEAIQRCFAKKGLADPLRMHKGVHGRSPQA